MDISGLAKLYPRAAAYVTRPNGLSIASKSTNMDSEYYLCQKITTCGES